MPHIVDTPLPQLEYYRIIRGQLEHEDDLISGRLSWFVASQSFLFSRLRHSRQQPSSRFENT